MSKNGINNITLPAYKEAIETVKGMVPGFQTTFAIAISLLVNLSGWELLNFKVIDVSTAQYTIKQIVNASDDSVLSEKRAKDYLKAMTGSEYLPKYSFEKPTYTYIIAENVIWKVQYDSEHGLLLYKMIELPSGGTQLYHHKIKSGVVDLYVISNRATYDFTQDIQLTLGQTIGLLFLMFDDDGTIYYPTSLFYDHIDKAINMVTPSGMVSKQFDNALDNATPL